MTTNDLDSIEKTWLRQCPACDAGLSMSCVCPADDPRNVIANLVDECKRLRDENAELRPVVEAAEAWLAGCERVGGIGGAPQTNHGLVGAVRAFRAGQKAMRTGQ